MAGTYIIQVDWNNDGQFASYEDITSDVKQITFSRGKDSQLGKASPGQCSIRVKNDDKKYSPEYVASSLHGQLLPKRVLRIRTISPVPVTLFYGFIEEIIPHPHWAEKDAYILAVDGLDFLARAEIDTPLYENQLTGTLIGNILNEAGWGNVTRIKYEYYDTKIATADNTQFFGVNWHAQTFTPATSHIIKSIKLYISTFYFDTPRTLTVGIRAVDGSGHPTGADLCSGSVIIPQSGYAWREISLGSGTLLTASTKYAIVVRMVGGDASNAGIWDADDGPGTYTSGNRERSTNSGGSWTTDTNEDCLFEEWGIPSTFLDAVDAGVDTVPLGYWHNVSARSALEELENNALGFIYIDGSGNPVFEDRGHRDNHLSAATFNDSMVGLTYSLNVQNIYNIIRAILTPQTSQSIAELWRLQEAPILAIGSTTIFYGQADYLVDMLTSPAATTDYLGYGGAGGTGTNYTSSLVVSAIVKGKTIEIEVVNCAAVPVYLYLLKARGTYYKEQTQVIIQGEDQTSQLTYQKRVLSIDGRYLQNTDVAKAICNYALARYANPRSTVTMTLMNRDDTMLTQILSRGISDRITIVNTELGMGKDYFIDYMEHEISDSMLVHRVTYHLSESWVFRWGATAMTGTGQIAARIRGSQWGASALTGTGLLTAAGTVL